MTQTKSKARIHKIGLYIRVSTEEQASNPEGSIKSQEQRLRNHIALKASEGPFGEVADVFVDAARSGKDTNRPELQRLLSAIRRGDITLVMVTELSRLSRSIKDFCDIWQMMQAQGCEFLSLREQFDTTTAAGEMVLFTVANIAQFERRQISERVTANVTARAERGLHHGTVPYGYRQDPENRGRLIVHEEEAELIREIFATFLRCDTIAEAGKDLHRRGYRLSRHHEEKGPQARLGDFRVGNLHTILTNESYQGIRVYSIKGEERRAVAAWEPIIDGATFARVQAKLKANHRRNKRAMDKRHPYLLSGLCVCATCADRMTGKSAHGRSAKYPYYEHSWATRKQACLDQKVFACQPHRVSALKLEPAVWSEVYKILSDPELAGDIIKEAEALHKSRGNVSEIERLQAKIKATDDQIDAMAEHVTKIPKDVSPEPIYRQMARLERVKEELLVELAAAKAQGRSGEMPAELRDYVALTKALRDELEDKGEALRTKIIQRLVHKVEIMPSGFRLHYFAGENHIQRINGPENAKAIGDSVSNLAPAGKLIPRRGPFSISSGDARRAFGAGHDIRVGSNTVDKSADGRT